MTNLKYVHLAMVLTGSIFATTSTAANDFNPDISVTLDGGYFKTNNHPEDYELPGFTLGGEAGLPDEGFGIGHTELTMSSMIDDQFFGQLTFALAEHDGDTELEIEEAFIESTGLIDGINIRFGRYFPHVGYLNEKHNHAWDFADAPLIYTGLWGDKYIDDGVGASWVAPTDLYMTLGFDLMAGNGFPATQSSKSIGAKVFYWKVGGDIGERQSWQGSIHHYRANIEDRESGGGDAHGHESDETEVPAFNGDSTVSSIALVYKWAPTANFRQRHVALQLEYFKRDEDGDVEMEGSDPLEESSYEGEHAGYYVQSTFQISPKWRTGIRYDYLTSTHNGDDGEVLEEAGYDDEGIDPERLSFMVEWLPSEFSRIRAQFNRDDSYGESDNQFFLQYTMSLGAHGAHAF